MWQWFHSVRWDQVSPEVGEDSCRKLELPCSLHPDAGRVPLLAKGVPLQQNMEQVYVGYLSGLHAGTHRGPGPYPGWWKCHVEIASTQAGWTSTASSSCSARRLKKWLSYTFDKDCTAVAKAGPWWGIRSLRLPAMCRNHPVGLLPHIRERIRDGMAY